MVNALDSGSKGSGASPGRLIVSCSWARHFTLTMPLSTLEYKRVPVNCQGNLRNAGVNLRLTSIPYGRSSNIPASLMLRKTG